MQNDPFGYYARKAQREAAIRAAAPYRIDDSAEAIPTYEELERRLEAVGLGADLERRRDGAFAIVDLMTACHCGLVWSAA